ncbi:predicted protein [Nematostella vectensis]|uniref:Peroxisomal 2,4-dienoyl-CoA reductase [(3E)-enoyl-CoA-producing] n=1 Tax=Nematostella vectensis TaxID=45351 RepID=A7SXR1_NEMVE|nr:predicted protein [Nematostella vectensis]|eukprot:XP_001623602.1 predicted protein [Nematostella vectensis]
MAAPVSEESCLDSYDYFFRPDLLAGKVAFVTGGGSGIGFTITEVLMRHGCNTVIASRNFEKVKKAAEKLEKCTGQRCLPIQMDVRKVNQVEEAVNLTLKTFNKIDIIVNNAAGNFLCPAENLSYNAIRTVFDIDTFGTFNMSKAVYNSWFKDHGGSIVNITATLSDGALPLQAMVKHLAVEWGPQGVRVNCVAPGPIEDTEGMSRLGRGVPIPPESTPLRRVGTRRDVADAVLFLASNASSYVTAQTLVVDGGTKFLGARMLANISRASKL